MIKVRIPATTANMGPGFDTFGMALEFYNEIEFIEIEEGFEFYIEGNDTDIPIEENLIINSLLKVLKKHNYNIKGFKINISKCDIPLSRGMGSSSSCIIGALLAANALLGNKLSKEDIINEATEIEGHPDNVVPAYLGGMLISTMNEGQVVYSSVHVPESLRMIVMIPNFKTNTEEAREVLPASYSIEDCIFNISRAAVLVNVLNNNELDKLRVAMQDKIHQDYRKKLINNSDAVFHKSQELGALAEFVSGSGSTLMSIIHKDNIEFVNKMKEFLSQLDDEWKIHLLKPDFEGAILLS
ncbi:homoserine kinase [Clostridium sediminicola]|uniref:homoserine kinase n=1 Tax=Clostridium sediminicola TaxID=3114879 RepID=UPI0031F22C44